MSPKHDDMINSELVSSIARFFYILVRLLETTQSAHVKSVCAKKSGKNICVSCALHRKITQYEVILNYTQSWFTSDISERVVCTCIQICLWGTLPFIKAPFSYIFLFLFIDMSAEC